MKQCSTCKDYFDPSNFYINKGGRGGLDYRCKTCAKKYSRERHHKNNPEALTRTQPLVGTKKERNRQASRDYRERVGNKEKIRNRQRAWMAENRDVFNARRRARRLADPKYKIKTILRARLRKALRGKNKSESTLALVGCSIPDLIQHIESLFTEGMTWENHGLYGWHLDHIKPCAAFDLEDLEQQRECFNYNNLQPLWAADNRKKSNKYPSEIQRTVQT
jgi:hypothetical protein